MILAGDIGSTRSYMGIYKQDENKNLVLVFPSDKPKQYGSADYPHMESMIEAFLQEANINETIYAACFGISGQPENGYIIGLDWKFSQEKLCDFWVEHSWKKKMEKCNEANIKQLPIVRFVNNMEGIDFNKLLKSSELVELNNEATNTTNDKDKFGVPFKSALIGVRGGLAETLVYWGSPPGRPFDKEKFNILPSQGGNANLAPSSKEELELLNYLFEHPEYLEHPEMVTYQDVLSERGIVSIYQFVKNKKGEKADEVEKLIDDKNIKSAAREIFRAALEDNNALCDKAIDLFFSIYGAEAGNLALRYYARGGVYYIHGSITPPDLVGKLIEKIKHGTFMQAFTRRTNPQIVDLLKSIPVKFVQDADIRLHGAVWSALRKEQLARVLYNGCKE
ncbi:glucokinase [Beggiatoa sp. PS]|nr:glucokinase [Beggiatoa sp. PS]